MDYTLGFMFSENSSKVLLILKDRPQWQAGKLNGIGGKIEDKDLIESTLLRGVVPSTSALCAIVREFKEETSIKTTVEDWQHFATITGTETKEKTGTAPGLTYNIYCFRAFSDQIDNAKQMKSETPIICYVKELDNLKTLPNVQWLIPMALYTKGLVPLKIKYN